MPSVSKKQQRFFGIIRAIKKGVFKGKKTPEIQRAASSISDKDSKKMASTKHKGLPEKVKEELNTDDKPFVKKLVGKLRKGSKTHAKQADDLEKAMNEDYVKELEDGLVKMDYPSYDEVDKLMCKIAKDNDIDTTTLHMAFKTKHLMVPDDWAKKKMMEPVMIPKTPKITGDVKEGVTAKQRFKRDAGAIAKKKIKQKEHNKYVNFLDVDEAVNAAQQAAIAISKRERLQDLKVAKKRKLKKEDYEPVISEKCWKGYEKKGMKTMFGKRYPNCVKKKKTRKEEYVMEKSCGDRDEYGDKKGGPTISTKEKKKNLSSNTKDEFSNNESYSANPAQQAAIAIAKKNRKQDLKVAEKKKISSDYKPDMDMIEDYHSGKGEINVERTRKFMAKKGMKGAPGLNAMIARQEEHKAKRGKKKVRTEEVVSEAAAWTRKAGKNPSGGLNEKGRKSYERANPGSDLKAPSKKKGNKRRKSFCARMKGMKKKLTSAKTARDPNSRINKSLRAWNCSYEPDRGEIISETMLSAIRRKKEVLNQSQKKKPQKAMDAGARLRRKKQREEHRRYVNDIIPDHLKDEYMPIIEAKNKCGKGEYYCNDDKKCKPIPKGYRIGYGGYLKPENKEDESNGKKGGSNGNGNGNGGNGNGHGGNGNGGNGGGNGGGE